MAKETCLCGKRDLHIWQKRPTYVAEETYIYGKRGLHMWQKRPTNVTWRRSFSQHAAIAALLCHIIISYVYVTSSYHTYMSHHHLEAKLLTARSYRSALAAAARAQHHNACVCDDVTYACDDVTYACDDATFAAAARAQHHNACVRDDVTYVCDDVTCGHRRHHLSPDC